MVVRTVPVSFRTDYNRRRFAVYLAWILLYVSKEDN